MDYTYLRSGINGCELINKNGEVFAWTISVGWAAIVIDMLNMSDVHDLEGVSRNMDEETRHAS